MPRNFTALSKKRRSLSPTIVGAGCGLIVGIFYLMFFGSNPNSFQPVDCAIISPIAVPPDKQEHTLDVRILTIWHYQKTSTTIEPLRREMMILLIASMSAIVMPFIVFGAVLFRQFDRWIRKAGTEKHTEEMIPFR